MAQTVDTNYCMSSFLTFRYIWDKDKVFVVGMEHPTSVTCEKGELFYCKTAEDIDCAIKKQLSEIDLSDAVLLLSGGMDSAILASYMPKGTKALTAKCSAEGAIDETERAAQYCHEYGLEHVIVDVSWSDYETSMDALMINDGCPVFANEPQVYKLAMAAKQLGAKKIIFGDNADMAFGGMDRLLSQDWDYQGWVKRYTFVEPEKVLKNPISMEPVYSLYKVGEHGIDFIKFMDEVFAASSTGAYLNAFDLADVASFDPYAHMKMAEPLDLQRVRSGESKYLIRELFKMKYPNLPVPEKIAMPRAVDQWLADWKGPNRTEFIPGCADGMSGEQKFLLYSLERFLNLLDKRN